MFTAIVGPMRVQFAIRAPAEGSCSHLTRELNCEFMHSAGTFPAHQIELKIAKFAIRQPLVRLMPDQ